MMIEHVYINNYKAFNRENVSLERHTLLVGTNASGKTTVLEALDLFFNHVMRHDFIIDQNKSVIVEVQMNGQRFRKVYSPPYFKIDYSKCIGSLYDINHYAYLYVPEEFDIPTLLNDILNINLKEKLSKEEQTRVFKIADYIDGITGNTNYPFFAHKECYLMDIKEPPPMSMHDCAKSIANITHRKTIIGIDNYEVNFSIKDIKAIRRYANQTIFATDDPSVIRAEESYVTHLLTGEMENDYEAIQRRLTNDNKKYILVEGKYDIAWFEKALKLLNRTEEYAVLPCGGSGNIQYVKKQLDKEGLESITIADGDTKKKGSLKREIIELYADVDVVNKLFDTDFDKLPRSKKEFFKHISEKDDVVKHILSQWARKQLVRDNPFVQELQTIL